MARQDLHVPPSFPSLWEGDEDFRRGVPLFHVSDGVGGLRQGVSLVNHRDYFSGLNQLAQARQVVAIDIRNQESELLTQERRPQESLEHSDQSPPEFLGSSRHDTLAIWTLNPLHRPQGAVSHVIEKQVIAFAV